MGFIEKHNVGQEEIFNVSWINNRVVFHQMVQQSFWCTLQNNNVIFIQRHYDDNDKVQSGLFDIAPWF